MNKAEEVAYEGLLRDVAARDQRILELTAHVTAVEDRLRIIEQHLHRAEGQLEVVAHDRSAAESRVDRLIGTIEKVADSRIVRDYS